MIFEEVCLKDRKIIENHLQTVIPKELSEQKIVIEAMNYSLHAGGKRIRPMLFIETMKMFDKNYEGYLDVACALELIHTYSLIHDDLPAMDDDDLRRGKPTNHKVFGEAQAILAGDGLLNRAYEILFEFLTKNFDRSNLAACSSIAKAAGIYGMIGGQSVDVNCENKKINEKTMEFIHRHKTGALIETSMMSAAIMANASETEKASIASYAQNLGLLFQITDDLLDVIGDEKVLGKKTHHDEQSGKATYPIFYGIEKTKEIAFSVSDACFRDLSALERNTDFFMELTKDILHRKK